MAANRTKTIEYALPMLSTAASYQTEGSTHLDSGDMTVYIPETTSRAFKSVALEVVVHDNHASVGADLSAFSVRGSCDSGSNWTTKTRASGYADSGENMHHIFIVDMTAEFTARFGSGSSGTFRWGMYLDYSATLPTWANGSAKLIITYDYDDTAHATRVKTVRIPIESFNGRLSNSAQEVKQSSTAANQLPALKHASTPFLPEDTVTIRQAFCELWTGNLPSATTDASLILKVDSGGSETTFGLVENANSTPINLRVLYDVTSEDWTSAHALYARHDVASQSYFVHLGGWLTVTYEYNHTNSTTILNSLLMGLGEDTLNVRTTGDDSYTSVDRFIEEPATITLVQSGVWVTAQTGTSSTTLSFKVGSQTATGYTPTAATTCAAMLSFVHRIDSNGHRGAGITLARGLNTFTAQWYATHNDYVGNVSVMMILNYTSGKHASGDGVHAHSVSFLARDTTTAATTANTTFTEAITPTIIESNYWLMSCMPVLYATGITGSTEYYVLQAEKESAAGYGWADIFVSQTIGGNERLSTISNAVARFAFKRHPNDVDSSRMNIETSRTWRWYGTSAIIGMNMWITYHSITFTVSGTVSDYAGSGGSLTVKLYRTDNGDYVGSATTSAGGSYSFTWYDNTINLFGECREDATHVGRSDNAAAS